MQLVMDANALSKAKHDLDLGDADNMTPAIFKWIHISSEIEMSRFVCGIRRVCIINIVQAFKANGKLGHNIDTGNRYSNRHIIV